MNWFHFSVSLGYKTTSVFRSLSLIMLWIAFIFQYLWDTKQQGLLILLVHCCCELLSFFSIFGIQNNASNIERVFNFVVNCFHFSVSLGYKTTGSLIWCSPKVLWIAFIFQYLWDTKQLSKSTGLIVHCCELLSFFSIFGIQNNWKELLKGWKPVVNCFHFSVSLGYKTTFRYGISDKAKLWIAFIFQYLWDTKQQRAGAGVPDCCCELLSFFSIFGIQNNFLV